MPSPEVTAELERIVNMGGLQAWARALNVEPRITFKPERETVGMITLGALYGIEVQLNREGTHFYYDIVSQREVNGQPTRLSRSIPPSADLAQQLEVLSEKGDDVYRELLPDNFDFDAIYALMGTVPFSPTEQTKK